LAFRKMNAVIFTEVPLRWHNTPGCSEGPQIDFKYKGV
jgi:hypothetical protein